MKKSLKVLIASSALILAGTLLAGCEEKVPVSQIHEHTFSTEWSANDGAHWHAATCEHTSVMSDVEDHKFGTWSQVKAPTQTEEGSQKRTCSVCGYEQVSTIARLDHTHVFAEAWTSDAEYHWHDATCHDNVRDGVAKHTFGDWTVTVQPTETTKGLKVRKCSVCQYEDKAEVDETLHVHTYEENWTTNESSHWKKATCGHNDSFKEFGAHQFGDWYDEVPSTETVAGSHKKKCSVCDYVLTEALPLAEHTHVFSNVYSADDEYHWYDAVCGHNVIDAKEAHTYSAWTDIADSVSAEYPNGRQYRECFECNHRQYRAKAHAHSLSDWISDETSHWIVCNAKGCDEAVGTKHNPAAHIWDRNYATRDNAKKCSVCGYVAEVAWLDATEQLPDEYITLEPQSTRAFVFQLPTKSNIRIGIISESSATNNSWTYNILKKDGTYIMSGYYLRNNNDFLSGKTYEAGEYIIAFRNIGAIGTDSITFLAHNASPVFTKSTVGTKKLTVGEEEIEYTMYKYVAKYDTNFTQYTIENPSGEEVYSFRNPKLSTQPNNFSDGYVYFVNNSGSTRYAGLPKYIYRSDALLTYSQYGSVYNYTYSQSNQAVTLYAHYDRLLNAYLNDPWISRRLNTQSFSAASPSNPYNELETKFVAWLVSNSNIISWVDSQWSLETSTNKYHSDIYGYACGFWTGLSWNSLKNELVAMSKDMAYDTTNQLYACFKNADVSERVYHIQNIDSLGGYSKFYWTNGATPVASPNYSMVSRSYMTILDENFKEIVDYPYRSANGKLYKDNTMSEFFEMEPGLDYYILLSTSWVTTSRGYCVADQTRYNITIDAGSLDGTLESAVAKNDLRKGERVYGDELIDYADANWDIPEDKLIVSWEDEDGNIINTSSYTSFQAFDYSTYTAHWINKKDVLATAYSITDWDDMDDSFEFQILDPELGIKDDDAVVFVYSDGTEIERMVYNSSTTVPLTSEDGSLYFYFRDYTDGMSTDFLEFEQENLLYIYLKREFELELDMDGTGAVAPGDGYAYYYPAKGDSVELERYKDIADGGYDNVKDLGGVDSYKYYFAGWGGGRNGATDVIVYDGGSYEPIRDESLKALYYESADSGMICLGQGDSGYEFKFVTSEGKEYLELKILDPNLTVKGNGDTEVTLRFSDGSTVVVSTVEVLSGTWGNLNAGATRADGTIHIRLRDSVTHDQLASAIQIFVA